MLLPTCFTWYTFATLVAAGLQGGARGEGPASASVDVNSCSIMSQEERGVVSASHRSVVVAAVDNAIERALVLPLHP